VAQPILNDEYNLLGNMLTNSLNLGQNANIANDPDLQEMSAGLDRWSGADQVNSILTFGSATRPTSNLRNRPNDWGGIALQAGMLRIPPRRNIPLVPDRILDAPGLDDDYYSNLMAWSERNELAIGLGDTAFLWNAENSNVESLDSGEPSANICSVSWSHAGDHLAVGREDGTTQIWDATTKQLLRTMYAPQTDTAYDPSTITNFNRVGALSWNNHILTSGHRSRIVCNHDVRQKDHLVKTLREHDGEVCGLTWRSDGQCLASGGNDNRVNVWDIRSDIPFRTTVIHKAAVKVIYNYIYM
jgi:cell division cycle protein 20 (cofactor of APC complex)